MKLRPIGVQRKLEQDTFRCRKVSLCVPYTLTPVPPSMPPQGVDVVYEYLACLERFTPQHFGPGPAREQVRDPEDIYFNEQAAQVFFLVPYLN